MGTRCWALLLVFAVVLGCYARATAEEPPPAAAAPIDIVTLKDGSVLYGEVLEMDGGILLLKNPANPDNLIKLKWDSVAKLTVTHPIPFHLKEGTVLNGTASAGPDGVLVIHAEPLKGTMEVPMSDVKSVNPLVQPSVIYVGNLTGGYSQTTGNSHLRNASLLGERERDADEDSRERAALEHQYRAPEKRRHERQVQAGLHRRRQQRRLHGEGGREQGAVDGTVGPGKSDRRETMKRERGQPDEQGAEEERRPVLVGCQRLHGDRERRGRVGRVSGEAERAKRRRRLGRAVDGRRVDVAVPHWDVPDTRPE